MRLESICSLFFLSIILTLGCGKDTINSNSRRFGGFGSSQTLNDQEKAILISINDQVIPIKSISPQRPYELSSLENLKNHKVIGIGTATYGSKELFQIQDKAIRYFIKNHQFGGIAVEMDFAEAQYFNDYLLGLNNWSLDQIFQSNILNWPYRIEAFEELLMWIRQYNQETGERIQIMGFDNRETVFSCQLIKSKLVDYLPLHVDEINQLFQGCGEIKLVNYKLYSSTQKLQSRNVVINIGLYIQNNQNEIITNSGKEQFDILFQLSNNLIWTEEVIAKLSNNESYNLRESYMAQNVKWFRDFIEKPILLIGHNQRIGYIRNADQTGSLGFHLRNELDQDYAIIATSTGLGSSRVFDPILGSETITINKLKYPSLNFYFHHARSPIFALFLHQLSSEDLLFDLLQRTNPFFSMGLEFKGDIEKHYEEIVLTDYFDIILHVDQVQGTELAF